MKSGRTFGESIAMFQTRRSSKYQAGGRPSLRALGSSRGPRIVPQRLGCSLQYASKTPQKSFRTSTQETTSTTTTTTTTTTALDSMGVQEMNGAVTRTAGVRFKEKEEEESSEC